MERRVVITGMGAVTPIGNNVSTFWENVKIGKHGIGVINQFDTTDYKVHIGAEVKDFVAKNYIDGKSAKRMELFSQYAVVAAKEAIEDSGLDIQSEDPYRIGTIIGSGVGSLQRVELSYETIIKKGPQKANPLMVPLMISNMAAGNISIYFGLKGKSLGLNSACASGTHSAGEAFRSIKFNECDVMITGGAEACICPTGLAGFTNLTALTTNDDIDRASIPFDKDRSGFVLGEGAGVLVFEELDHARKRGAHIYAEVIGYGATSDAYHITSPLEDGSGAGMAMKLALKEGNIEAGDLDYINAHGTSTPLNDLFETRAIKYALGEHAYKVHINSTKSMIGHLLGAAGAVELITCVKSIEDSFIHQTVGTQERDEECDLDYTIGSPIEYPVRYAMSNSLGFGGHNASILIRKYED